MAVSLNPITINEKHILQNLYSLYLHDLSEFTDSLEVSSNGAFEFDSFDLVWEREGLSPYLLRRDETIVGFLLLLERPFLEKDYDYSVNDIFMLKKYRRKGFTISVLKQLFEQKKGKYYVLELVTNKPAVLFWRNIFSKLDIVFDEKKQTVDEDDCLIQSFQV